MTPWLDDGDVRRTLRDCLADAIEILDRAEAETRLSCEYQGDIRYRVVADPEQSGTRCSFCGWHAPTYTALVEHHERTPGHKA